MPPITACGSVLFDYKPAKAFQRMNPHKEMDRLEQEGEDFMTGYTKASGRSGRPIRRGSRRIDVSGTKFETRDRMQALMDEVLAQW